MLALRESIVHSYAIREDGDNLVLKAPSGDVVAYPKSTKTAFRSSSGGHYALIALWLQWTHKDKQMSEMWAEYEKRGLAKGTSVMVTDKRPLISYLTGASDGGSNVDRELVSSSAPVLVTAATGGAGGEARVAVAALSATAAAPGPTSGGVVGPAVPLAYPGSALGDIGDVPSYPAALQALQQERSLRSRVTVLDAPDNVDLRDTVFKCFSGRENIDASSGGAGSGAAKAAPAGAGSSVAAGSRKREREPSSAAATAAAGEAVKRHSCTQHLTPRWRGLHAVLTRYIVDVTVFNRGVVVGGGGGAGGVVVCRRSPHHYRSQRPDVNDHSGQCPGLAARRTVRGSFLI